MIVRSLGYRTDLALVRFDGEVIDRGAYVVVRTPSNPTFYWGNFLLFPDAPNPDDLAPQNPDGWLAVFERERGAHPDDGHCLLAWDRVDGTVGAARSHAPPGFELDDSVVLTATRLHPPPHVNADVALRAITTDAEWADAEDVLTRAFTDRASDLAEVQMRFVRRQVARYRAMVRAGLGTWFGGYLEGALAGTLGVFVADGIGRYQLVGTSPDFRRRGVCGALVYGAGTIALREMGAESLVIAADASYHAARVYESVGLAPTERLASLIRRRPPAA